MDFGEYLRKSDVSENGKFYYSRFLRNWLHETRYISKSRWGVQKSANQVCWSKDEGGIGCSKFLLESTLECSYAYYTPPLLKGSTWVQRSKENRNEKKKWLLARTYKWYILNNFVWKNELANSLLQSCPLKSLNIRDVIRTKPNITNRIVLRK